MISSNKHYYSGYRRDIIRGIIFIVFGFLIMTSPLNDWPEGLIVTFAGVAMILIGMLNRSRFKVIMMNDQSVNVVDMHGIVTSYDWTQIQKIKRRLTLTPTYRLVLKDSDEDILFYSDWGIQEQEKGEIFPSINWTNRMGQIIEIKRKELRW